MSLIIPSTTSDEWLVRFMKSDRKSDWIVFGPMNAYVRKGVHAVDGKIIRTFDLANLDIVDYKKRGEGTLKALLWCLPTRLRQFTEIKHVYVESVLNHALIGHLKRNGFVQVPDSGDPEGINPPNFIKQVIE